MALDFIQFINTNTPNLTAAQKTAMLSDFCENFGSTGLTAAEQKAFANERIQSFVIQSVNETRKIRAEKALQIDKLVITS